MRKGLVGAQIISVFTNAGADAAASSLSLTTAETGFVANEQLVEVIECTAHISDSNGGLSVAMADGLPRVFYSLARLIGSGICPDVTSMSIASAIYSMIDTDPATSALPTTALTACTIPDTVAITFQSHTTTVTGQTIKMVGDIAALGSWNVASGVALSASAYTVADPLWQITLGLAAGTELQYKYVNVAADGTATWENGDNRVFVVPGACATAATVSGVWQS